MICREQMDNPNDDGRYAVTGGRDDPNPAWCDCRQGECADGPVLGFCTHGVDLDRAFCSQGCRV